MTGSRPTQPRNEPRFADSAQALGEPVGEEADLDAVDHRAFPHLVAAAIADLAPGGRGPLLGRSAAQILTGERCIGRPHHRGGHVPCGGLDRVSGSVRAERVGNVTVGGAGFPPLQAPSPDHRCSQDSMRSTALVGGGH
jgi:hypothetical protein